MKNCLAVPVALCLLQFMGGGSTRYAQYVEYGTTD